MVVAATVYLLVLMQSVVGYGYAFNTHDIDISSSAQEEGGHQRKLRKLNTGDSGGFEYFCHRSTGRKCRYKRKKDGTRGKTRCSNEIDPACFKHSRNRPSSRPPSHYTSDACPTFDLNLYQQCYHDSGSGFEDVEYRNVLTNQVIEGDLLSFMGYVNHVILHAHPLHNLI